MSFSDTLENAVLDYLFGASALSQPATLWISLSTADPLDTAAGLAEPSGNGYARVAVVNDTNWWRASAAGVKQNSAELTFPEASGSWGTLTHVGIHTHATSTGVACLWGSGALGTSKAVTTGDTPRFQTDSLQVNLD